MKHFWNKLTGDDSGFTLVELMVVVAIIAILAGLAISQFGSTVQSAKSAEAEKFMKKVSQGAKTYYQTEQVCCGGKTGCKSPWHACSPAGSPAGKSVYPGGESFGPMKVLTAIPKSGSKLQPKSEGDFTTDELAVLKRLGVQMEDSLYFQYTYESKNKDQSAEATVKAIADFKGDGGDNHTVTQTLGVKDGDPQVGTAFTSFEGE